MIKLSKTSKLDGILSWSLEALKTCSGAIEGGQLVPACEGCYARSGNYRFPNVKAPRIHNKQDWKRKEWVSDMVKELDNERYFRWFDSGDIYSVALATKIHEVIRLTPHVKHWIPTRQYKFAKWDYILNKIKQLPNAMVRNSSDSVTGKYDNRHGSVIGLKEHLTDVKICEAYENGGKCNGCRACWDKNIPVIGYIAHGKTMAKVVTNQLKMEGIIG